MSDDFVIEVEIGDDWETFERWEIFLRSASRAWTTWAAGIKDHRIAPYAALVENGSVNMPARPLFGWAFDAMAEESNVDTFINEKLDVVKRGEPPGLHAIPSFMDPLCDALGQDFVKIAKERDGFVAAPNSAAWAQEKEHSTPWLGYLDYKRLIHDIDWPHALDSLFVWKLRSRRGRPSKPRKSRAKKDKKPKKPKKAKKLPKKEQLSARSVLGAVGKGLGAGGKGRRTKRPRFKRPNMDSQRFIAVGKSQSKKATGTRFKPQGAKGRKYPYNRPYGA